jgi:hypothetical protein
MVGILLVGRLVTVCYAGLCQFSWQQQSRSGAAFAYFARLLQNSMSRQCNFIPRIQDALPVASNLVVIFF